jgi:hypothetical protein
MKKNEDAAKKLEVNKEKVRPLTDEDLDGVAGGQSGAVHPTSRAGLTEVALTKARNLSTSNIGMTWGTTYTANKGSGSGELR